MSVPTANPSGQRNERRAGKPVVVRVVGWAWHELNVRPHAYQARCLKASRERCESPSTGYAPQTRIPAPRTAPECGQTFFTYRTQDRTHESVGRVFVAPLGALTTTQGEGE